jgi:hypothetical protein
MRYLASINYIFRAPNWLTILALGSVSFLVPVLGPLVLTGYLYELEEEMRRTGDERPRDIDFNRLVPYLMRGVWPFLITMIVQMVLGIVLTFVAFVLMALFSAVFASMSPQMAPVGVLLGVVATVLLSLVIVCLLGVVMVPMMLRAAYHLDFGAGFDMAFVKDFLRRVGKELILSQLFLAVVGSLLILAGLMVFCVGVYVAAAVVQFAQIHLVYQLQKLYEERGGTPLVFKPYEAGPSRSAPPPEAFRDDREGVYRPDEPGPGKDTGIQI